MYRNSTYFGASSTYMKDTFFELFAIPGYGIKRSNSLSMYGRKFLGLLSELSRFVMGCCGF